MHAWWGGCGGESSGQEATVDCFGDEGFERGGGGKGEGIY